MLYSFGYCICRSTPIAKQEDNSACSRCHLLYKGFILFCILVWKYGTETMNLQYNSSSNTGQRSKKEQYTLHTSVQNRASELSEFASISPSQWHISNDSILSFGVYTKPLKVNWRRIRSQSYVLIFIMNHINLFENLLA